MSLGNSEKAEAFFVLPRREAELLILLIGTQEPWRQRWVVALTMAMLILEH
jgi:hypothetical protein